LFGHAAPGISTRMIFRFVLLLAALSIGNAVVAQTPAVPESGEQVRLSFAPVVKRTAPAVVNVFSRRVVRTGAVSPLLNDPVFRRFFGDAVPFGMPQERIQNSLGSGVIVGSDGLIVTNHHVIKDADEITVVLSDRREFEAKRLRSDERTDLAILKIDAKGETLAFLELGDSDALEVGDLVLAIGNPFGVGQTVTSGIVSALARTQVGIADFRFFIQTDAAINPGNSGGALVGLDGKLVGINTAIYSRSGGSIGIGFAIPTSMVKTVLAGAGAGGRVVRPWLGASGQPVTNEIAASLGLKRPVGVLLKEVSPGSPAAQAGLKTADVVLSVNAHEVEDAEALRFRIATIEIGGNARLLVWRGGSEREVIVRVVAPPEDPPRDETILDGKNPLAGAKVANLSPALADELGRETTARGVVVLDIERGSIAQRLRVAPGDVVANVNNRAITSVAQLKQLLGGAKGPWTLAVKRGDKLLSITVNG
jgi:Do/DeqQ family serine protease